MRRKQRLTSKTMLMKTKWYARPHNESIAWGHGCETAVANQATIIPITMYDEGLGAPSSYAANPEHASFAEAGMPNCYPNSRINVIRAKLTVQLSKAAIQTDKVVALRYAYMPIFTTFDDIAVNDEVSGLDIGELLELQRETTDRQTYPLFNTVDMLAGTGAAVGLLDANVPGLT